MLKDALEYMHENGKKSAGKIVKTDAEPSHIYYIRGEDGTLTKTEATPFPVIGSKACTLQAVVEKAKGAEVAEVWYAPAAVVCIYGDAAKRNRITLDLVYSEPLLALINLKKTKQSLTQPEIIRLMRTTFRDSLSQAGQLIEVLRKVNFKATSEVEGVVQHGKSSLGKQIMGEVTGLGIIPEYVKFNFQMYANSCFGLIRGTIECALEPDASNGTFQIIPLPGQIEAAQDAALLEIGESLESFLKDSGVKLFHGSP